MFFEIAIKHRKSPLSMPLSAEDARMFVRASQFAETDYDATAAVRMASLPLHHRDPFDRMLIAHAIALGAAFVSADREVARYAGPLTIIGEAGTPIRAA